VVEHSSQKNCWYGKCAKILHNIWITTLASPLAFHPLFLWKSSGRCVKHCRRVVECVTAAEVDFGAYENVSGGRNTEAHDYTAFSSLCRICHRCSGVFIIWHLLAVNLVGRTYSELSSYFIGISAGMEWRTTIIVVSASACYRNGGCRLSGFGLQGRVIFFEGIVLPLEGQVTVWKYIRPVNYYLTVCKDVLNLWEMTG